MEQSQNSNNKASKDARFIWKYLLRHGPAYIVGLVALFVVDFVNLYIPQYTGEIVGGLEEGTLDRTGLFSIITKIIIVGLIIMTMRFLWRYTIFGSCRKIEFEIRNDLYAHLSKQSVNYYNENKTGDLMSYFTNDLGAIRQAVGMAVISTFDAVVMSVMVLVKMITYVDLRLTLLALIPMLFIFAGGIKYGKEIEKRFDKKQEAFSKMSDSVQETISGIRVIKAFVQEKTEEAKFEKINLYNKKKNLKIVSLMAVIMPLLHFLIGLSGVITLFYGGKLVLTGEIKTAQFVAFVSYINMLVWPMLAMGESITSFSQGLASMKRIGAVFNVEPEIKDNDITDENILALSGNISINNLTFGYKKELPEVLKNVSTDIPKGTSLAIVGKTGCGKTTICNLLLRLYDCEAGMISFDGHDIHSIPLKTLRSEIAYVPQDNFLFSDSIQTNIAFGKRKFKALPRNRRIDRKLILSKAESIEAYLEKEFENRENEQDKAYGDLSEVIEAAKAACIHDNITEFPKGYATMVGERGVTVSGGQKQRSSIARALMKESPILILDDSLSAVDTDTEEGILNNLSEIRAGKTTIIVAHRVSTIEKCDKIAVLDEGRIVEYGTHDELVKLGGQYAALYEKQKLEGER